MGELIDIHSFGYVRLGLDRRYDGLVASDAVISKALRVSEIAQVARIETRLRSYIDAKWNVRANVAIKVAVRLAMRGRPASEISNAVGKEMVKWARDVSDRFIADQAAAYRLARIAGHRKAITRSKESLQYSTTNYTEESVEKAKAKALPSFDVEDADAIEALNQQQMLWIGDFYDNNVSHSIRETARTVMAEAGKDRVQAGKEMARRMRTELGHVRTPDGFNGSTKQYFEGLVANAMTVSRAHGQMRSFREARITRYEIVNPLDERTCPLCSHMDGKTFTVRQGSALMDAELAAKTPGQVKKVHPWMTSKSLKAISPTAGRLKGTAGVKDAAALAEAGLSLPPYHFRCRCAVDISDEAGSYEPLSDEEAEVEEAPEAAPPPSPLKPKPKPKRERLVDRVLRELASPDLEELKPLGGGVNASWKATFDAGEGKKISGVWKPALGEDPLLRPGVKGGTYYQREAATFELDRMLGGVQIVPPTITRELAGTLAESKGVAGKGSIQFFDKAAKKNTDVQGIMALRGTKFFNDNKTARKMHLLDLISGNDDRHEQNVMWKVRKGKGPGGRKAMDLVAIDNGLTFPDKAPVRFIFGADDDDFMQAALRLDAESIKNVNRVKLNKLAEKLMIFDGIPEKGIEGALVRLRALQINPDVVSFQPLNRVMTFMRHSANNPEKLVGQDELDKIRKVIAKASAKVRGKAKK